MLAGMIVLSLFLCLLCFYCLKTSLFFPVHVGCLPLSPHALTAAAAVDAAAFCVFIGVYVHRCMEDLLRAKRQGLSFRWIRFCSRSLICSRGTQRLLSKSLAVAAASIDRCCCLIPMKRQNSSSSSNHSSSRMLLLQLQGKMRSTPKRTAAAAAAVTTEAAQQWHMICRLQQVVKETAAAATAVAATAATAAATTRAAWCPANSIPAAFLWGLRQAISSGEVPKASGIIAAPV